MLRRHLFAKAVFHQMNESFFFWLISLFKVAPSIVLSGVALCRKAVRDLREETGGLDKLCSKREF